MYISEPDDWIEKCVNDPRWVAESLQRIGRFGGQHPTSNVLIHSLEVAWMLRGSTPDVQLWALYHDAHEILTGDTPMLYKTLELPFTQMVFDRWLKQSLGIDGDYEIVTTIDRLCGKAEHDQWDHVIFQYVAHDCVSIFEIKARSLMATLAATRTLNNVINDHSGSGGI